MLRGRAPCQARVGWHAQPFLPLQTAPCTHSTPRHEMPAGFVCLLPPKEKPRVLPNRGCTREGAPVASLARWQSSRGGSGAPREVTPTWGNRGLRLQVSIPLPDICGAQQQGPSAWSSSAHRGEEGAQQAGTWQHHDPEHPRGTQQRAGHVCTLLLGAHQQHRGPKRPLWGLSASCLGASRQREGCWCGALFVGQGAGATSPLRIPPAELQELTAPRKTPHGPRSHSKAPSSTSHPSPATCASKRHGHGASFSHPEPQGAGDAGDTPSHGPFSLCWGSDLRAGPA